MPLDTTALVQQFECKYGSGQHACFTILVHLAVETWYKDLVLKQVTFQLH